MQAYAVIDLLMPDPSDVLDHRRNSLRASEEDQRLVNSMGAKVVCQAVRRGREIFPCAFQRRTKTIKSYRTKSAPDYAEIGKEYTPRFKFDERP